MEKKQHYFFAVELPKEAKEFLHSWVQSKKDQLFFERWVHPLDYHITLAFLGFAKEDQLRDAILAVKKIAEQELQFTLCLDSLGTFGLPKSPRILWAGVKPSEDLHRIQQKVFQECEKIGFQLDKKPFRPHITLARKWSSEKEYGWSKEKMNKSGRNVTFTVENIILYRTDMEKTPKYTPYAVFPLRPLDE